MLAVATILALIGFGLLLYFSNSAATHRAMNFTRTTLAVALLAHAVSEFCLKLMVYNRDDEDWLAGAAVAEGIGWVALLIGIKGIFLMLVTRAIAKKIPPRLEKVASPPPDLSEQQS